MGKKTGGALTLKTLSNIALGLKAYIIHSMDDKKHSINWKDFEFTHYPKSKEWSRRVIIIGGIVFLLALISKNFLFALFIAIATFVFLVLATLPPRHVDFEITEKGIRVGSTLYLFHSLQSFWMRKDEHPPKLVLKSEKFFIPYIIIPLGDTNPDEVKNYMLKYLKEDVHEKDLIEVIADYIQF